MVHAPDRTRRLLARLGFRLGGEGVMQGQRRVGAVAGPTHNVPKPLQILNWNKPLPPRSG